MFCELFSVFFLEMLFANSKLLAEAMGKIQARMSKVQEKAKLSILVFPAPIAAAYRPSFIYILNHHAKQRH